MKKISIQYFKSIYKPERFSGLIMKIRSSTVTLFRNGKILIAGSKSEKYAMSVCRKASKMFGGILSDFKVQNIVASSDMRSLINKKEGTLIDLNILYGILVEKKFKVKYDPSDFTGLVVYIEGVTCTVFYNGKINFTGAKEYNILNSVFIDLITILEDNSIIEINI